jgi:CRP-like cAMP-binding protein
MKMTGVMTMTDSRIIGILKRSILFKDIDEEKIDDALFFFKAHVKRYRKGDTLHRMGEPMKEFGFVISGIVEVYTDDMEGNQMIMANVAEGETFGESLSYLDIEDTPVYVSAKEDSEIIWMSTKNLHLSRTALDDTGKRIYENFICMLATRTLNMNDRIQILSKLTIRDKLITFLSQCERKYGSRVFDLPFDRESLSTYLGTNRSALSRELSKMMDEGIISFSKNRFEIKKSAY